MSYEAFSEEWARQWAQELRVSDAYRTAAATWEGSLALVMKTAGGRRKAVFADLWHGECRDARLASDQDRESADFAIAADIETWEQVLAGTLEPVMGIMSGRLQLERGSLAALVPQVKAAQELVAAAARVDTVFPSTEGVS